MEEFSRDMQMIADIIGEEAVVKLINEIGGISVYIPKPQAASMEEVIRVLRGFRYDVKKASRQLGLSQSHIYALLKQYREDKLDSMQGNLFND